MGVQLPSEPMTRKEQYLAKAAGQAVEIPAEPITREEAYLDAIAKGSGGGGGGTTNYNQLSNKPQINGTTLTGNKSASDLSLASTADLAGKVDKVDGKGLSTNDYTDAEKAIVGGVTSALQGKVDKVDGYGLSENNYTNADKSIVGGVTTALTGKVDKVEGKGLSENDYTNSDKAIVDGVTAAIALKQDKTDNSLDTEAKTIVGAINEHEGDISTLKSGLTNLDNEVNGDATTYPYADVITIEDAVPSNLADCSVKIEPVQDLHGQSAPYVGGAGRQKLPLTVDVLKALNTTGTWSGNTYTISNLTIEIKTDVAGNVTGFNVNGTPSNRVLFNLGNFTDFLSENVGYIVTSNTYDVDNSPFLQVQKSGGAGHKNIDGAYEFVYTSEGNNQSLVIRQETFVSASNVFIQPMIRLATETDATFAPYTNICPISGHTEASVQRTGTNMCMLGTKSIDSAGYVINNNGINNIGGLSAGKYTISFDASGYASGAAYEFILRDKDNNSLSSNSGSFSSSRISFTATIADTAVRIMMYANSSSGVTINNLQIEKGEEAHDYQPYAGQTYTIALGDTIYGGTVDFDSGVMTANYIEHTYEGSNDENWLSEITGQGYVNFYIAASDALKPQSGFNSTAISNIAPLAPSPTISLNCFHVSVAGNLNVCIGDAIGVSTVADFKTWLSSNHLQVVYELATPTTIQLTPQQIQLLKGTNTLTASTGDISVTVNGVSGSIGAVQEQVNELLAKNGCSIKVVEYTGDGTTQHSINLGTNVKWVAQLSRKDGGIWLNAFIPTQTQTRVFWRVPNSGENYVTLSFASGVLTIDGVDAGQTLNSDGVDYVLVYYESE